MFDWDIQRRLAPAASLSIEAAGEFAIAPSRYSDRQVALDADGMQLASCFARPASAREALTRLRALGVAVAEGELEAAIEELAQSGILVVMNAAANAANAAAANAHQASGALMATALQQAAASIANEADARYFASYDDAAPLEQQGLGVAQMLEQAARAIGHSISGARVLDLGCALGHGVAALRERGCEAFGVELSAWAVAHAVPEAARFVFLLDATDLRVFPDGAFDFLIANLTPHIAPETMAGFLRDASRVARVGVHVRYITGAWVDRLAQRIGARAQELYAPWTRDHGWWTKTFAEAGLRELSRTSDPRWDSWVLAGR